MEPRHKCKTKTINLLGVKIEKYLVDLGVGKDFLESTQKAITIKENSTSLKLRSSAHQNASLKISKGLPWWHSG